MKAELVFIMEEDTNPLHCLGVVEIPNWDAVIWPHLRTHHHYWFLSSKVTPTRRPGSGGTYGIIAPLGCGVEVETAYRLGGIQAVLPYWELKEK